MELSKNGLELIKRFEGVRYKAYKCLPTEKYYTIGYGHYGSDVKEGMEITEREAERLLMQDVKSAVNVVNRDKKHKYNQNQFDALVSFTYNCGGGSYNTLTRNRDINQIGNALTLYNKSGGRVIQGLVNRRNAEKALYFS